jgi:hypothetical protein
MTRQNGTLKLWKYMEKLLDFELINTKSNRKWVDISEGNVLKTVWHCL